jgi:uncharacterized protein
MTTMAKSNRDRVGEVMDALKEGLGVFVLREYKQVYKAGRYLQEIELNLNSTTYSAPHLPNEAAALTTIDTQGWLKLMWSGWNDVFKAKLGQSERNYVSELMTARNDWAHQKAFTGDDAQRCADTASRLLESVGALKEAIRTKAVANELLRLRFEAEATKAATKLPDPQTMLLPTLPGLKPWRLVVQPHPDVASGRYIVADFVANIADVMAGRAQPEYGNPAEFFRRTFLTEGLVSLLSTGVKRMTGLGGDPVVQLQTSFGGGKTHSMLAMYHLFSGKIGFSQIPGGEAIREDLDEDIDDVISANRAVIVGTAFSATEPRRYANLTTHTLWGEIAYQLGREKGGDVGALEAYRLVERADLAGISPGSDTLVELFENFGPALIIIDELVAFARNLPTSGDRVPAGTFDSTMTFFQSLTEAVKRSSDSMLLVSIPESENEIGGELGKAALEILSKTIGRMESVWKPVTANESFEIVRRRLFSEMDQASFASRDAVVNAFCEMYRMNKTDFPTAASEADYVQRMKGAYPIHPELFDRLYQDWSTLDRFQRTRGVLRLMATVIARLWQDNDQSLLIMPAMLPLWTASVRNEILKYLPETWPAIVDADIDGEGSKPYAIDKSVPTLGQHSASRRVARSIFIGSAPSVAGQAVRGVEEVRIRLATVQPGEPLHAFTDALRRMSQQLTYLYSDGSRYWYDTRPTVNRLAQDRAQNLHPDVVYQEAITRLRAVKHRKEDFAAAHVAPQTSGDVADEQRARVVVLSTEYTHKKGNAASNAIEEARKILESRGSSPRLYRNMLVFIAPDATDAEAWEKALRQYLAWKSIEDEKDILNLDTQQIKQVEANKRRTEETVLTRLQETYSWLIVPAQPDPTGPVDFQTQRIPGQDSFYDRAARKLRQSGWLVPKWSPESLQLEMVQYNLWGDGEYIKLKQLWEYLSRYCYLPRLYDQEVLVDAVREGVSRLVEIPFGYATLVDKDGRYKGLVFGPPGGTIYFDDNAVLVRPEAAAYQRNLELLQQEAQKQVEDSSNGRAGQGDSGKVVTGGRTEPKPKVARRYHGTISLDPQRPNREFTAIVEEIVQRLTSLTGTEVEITIEISAAREAGFDDTTVRTISENSRTLKFKHHGFEGE